MKCTTIITEEREEVLIYTPKITDFIIEIENLILSNSVELVGYIDKDIIKLKLNDIYCFNIENNKVYAHTKSQKLQLKQRLYEIEGIVDDSFVKINQSCIVNINKIKSFNASFTGSLLVKLNNGYQDYVSRRQLKIVKERLDI